MAQARVPSSFKASHPVLFFSSATWESPSVPPFIGHRLVFMDTWWTANQPESGCFNVQAGCSVGCITWECQSSFAVFCGFTAESTSHYRGFDTVTVVTLNLESWSFIPTKGHRTHRVFKRKHVFQDLCCKREEKKKPRAFETGRVIQLEKNMFSVSTMEQEPPLEATQQPCDCRERQRDFYFGRSHAQKIRSYSKSTLLMRFSKEPLF